MYISASEPSLEGELNITNVNYLTSLFNRLKHEQTAVRENLTLSKIKTKTKHYYDKKINSCNFNKEDYMYLLKQLQKEKLDNQYLGSYLIIDKIDNHNVKLATGKKTY